MGVDVGGTFTDFVILDEETNEISVKKVPSTPSNPAEAILTGLGEYAAGGLRPDTIGSFLHGTTITTNTLIQKRGARAGLVLTRGLRGIYQVQSQMREGPRHSLANDRPPGLIDMSSVFEVKERVDYSGSVVEALDEEEGRRVAAQIAALGLEAIAICFVFSFANPDHEFRMRDLIHEVAPECRVVSSADILPRIREWPRMSTTILEAYLGATLRTYVQALASGLRDRDVRTPKAYLMESNGGLMPFTAVTEGDRAVQTILSGPAAAVQAARRLAGERGLRNLLTMDIGGTSCDVAFVQDGNVFEVTSGNVCGYDVLTPMLEISTIGAGGGTIARVDADGRLLVGPESAGAEPGPAGYGRGGIDATITDADVVLGYLNPAYFLGGAVPLDAAASLRAVEERVAKPLRMSSTEAAEAIVRVNDVHMADAVRVVAAKAGISVADCTLVACGGAGPVHAVGVANELGIRTILVPESPGVFAALGLLCTDIGQDYIQTAIARLDSVTSEHIEAQFKSLETRALDDLARQGFSPSEIVFVREIDARYAGQGFEVPVEVNSPLGELPSVDELATLFHRQHHSIYGHSSPGEGLEVVNYRIRAVVEMPQYSPSGLRHHGTGSARANARTAVFSGQARQATVLRRSEIGPGQAVDGPAIIEQPDTTTVVPPGWSAGQDEIGNLVLTLQS